MFKINFARLIIGLIIFINLQSAFSFLAAPENYAPAYELIGEPGEAAIQGFGVLFIMWNIPYFFALYNPVKNRMSLMESISMQSIGVIGETYIYLGLSSTHVMLRDSIQRFILFDTAGLIGLVLVALFLRVSNR